eukprot:13627889-Ditylum_brightwellii.AAC.1
MSGVTLMSSRPITLSSSIGLSGEKILRFFEGSALGVSSPNPLVVRYTVAPVDFSTVAGVG